MNDKWQDNLRNRMINHEEPAPEGLWSGLEKRMVAENMNSGKTISETYINKSVIKKYRFWGISISAVAAAIILLFFVLNFPENNPINDAITYENKSIPEFTDKSVSEKKEEAESTLEPLIKSPVETIMKSQAEKRIKPDVETTKEPPVLKNYYVEKNVKNTESQKEKSETEESVSKELLTEDNTPKESDLKEKKIKESTSKEVLSKNLYPESKKEPLFASTTKTNYNKRSRWQSNVSMSNAPSGSTQTYSGYGTFAVEETVDQQYAITSQYTREEAYTDVEHDQPITFGLTLKYNINDKWSLSSGLMYSKLSSQLRSVSTNYYYDDTQTLHYLGIPLNLGYTLWQNNKISTYISTGGLAEKNIAGKLTSNYYIDDELESTTKRSITSRQLQWSVNSAVGIEYRVSDLIGIYAEPGVVYYFNNGSELETIYKDRPVNFNLRIGLRINFNK